MGRTENVYKQYKNRNIIDQNRKKTKVRVFYNNIIIIIIIMMMFGYDDDEDKDVKEVNFMKSYCYVQVFCF